jgi:Mrp family chromosome partitioning ATPase
MLADDDAPQRGTRTTIIAPPPEAGLITGFLRSQKRDDGSPVFSVIAREQEIGPGLVESLKTSLAEVLILHGATPGFKAETVRAIVRQHGQFARIVVALVPAVGGWFDAVAETGALVYRLPMRVEPFEELAQALPQLLVEARQKYAQRALAEAVEADEEAAKMEEPGVGPAHERPPAGVRHPTQVLVAWSSKGGDGKSIIAAEAAWQLAQIAAHKTLLIDADMSRGYLAWALSRDAYRFAQRRNITTIAQEYLVKTKLTAEILQEHVYSLPDLTGQGASNLDILFGIASPEAATLPAFSADDGAQSVRFINALIQQAYGIYEFVIFDIGTAVTIPLHYAVLKASGHVLVIANPSRPSVAPTREGIRQLEAHQATTQDQLRLVVNRWSPRALIKRDELPDYFGIPVFATIPLVESDTMMGLINQGRFVSHAVWEDPEEYAALKPFVAGIAALSENFALGIVDILKKRMQPAKKRRAFFRK